MLLQTAISAIVQHRQRIDRAVERQFAPQSGQNIGAPLMGNTGGAQVLEPDRRDWMANIAKPGESMTGEHHTPVAVAEGAFGA